MLKVYLKKIKDEIKDQKESTYSWLYHNMLKVHLQSALCNMKYFFLKYILNHYF